MTGALEWTLVIRFLVALALGFLVGLERESGRRETPKFFFGGIRTFPIVAMLGFTCAWLSSAGVPAMLPAGFIAVAALAVVGYVEKMKAGRLGATSEVSALLTYVVGVMACLSDIRVPIAIGVINTLLLSEKTLLEGYVGKLGRTEILATLKFLLVTVVIYPFLPNVSYTVYGLNPARIWQIVVLVSAIGFLGYALSLKLGPRLGLPLSGFLGGIASSTAVSVATGRLAGEKPGQARSALQATLLAGSVMYLRLIVLVVAFGVGLTSGLTWRLAALGMVGFLLSLTVGRSLSEPEPTGGAPAMQNPVEIRVALLFACLFVGLKVAVSLAHQYLGPSGVLGLGVLAGLADVDPFVLSLVQGALSGRLMIQGLLIAVMVNTLAKGVYFVMLSRQNARQVMWRYGIWAACHVPLMWV